MRRNRKILGLLKNRITKSICIDLTLYGRSLHSGASDVQPGLVPNQVHRDGQSAGVPRVQLGLRPGLGIHHLLFWRSHPLLPQSQELWRLLLKYVRQEDKLGLSVFTSAVTVIGTLCLSHSAQPQTRNAHCHNKFLDLILWTYLMEYLFSLIGLLHARLVAKEFCQDVKKTWENITR